MKQTKSAPLLERSCERFSAEPELLLLLTTDAADSTRGKRHAASDLRTPIQQDISLKNDGGASGWKAGNNADCESTVFHRCLLVVIGSAGDQPLGSTPRCCSSLRSTRLIQVAKETSPSALAASSNCALNSSGSRIWYGGDRFSNGVDMVITLNYYSYMVITIVLTIVQKATPRKCCNTGRASNHNPNHPE